jgi:hypothetical protein
VLQSRRSYDSTHVLSGLRFRGVLHSGQVAFSSRLLQSCIHSLQKACKQSSRTSTSEERHTLQSLSSSFLAIGVFCASLSCFASTTFLFVLHTLHTPFSSGLKYVHALHAQCLGGTSLPTLLCGRGFGARPFLFPFSFNFFSLSRKSALLLRLRSLESAFPMASVVGECDEGGVKSVVRTVIVVVVERGSSWFNDPSRAGAG